MIHKHGKSDLVYLTGGLCEVGPFIELLSLKLDTKVKTNLLARYAGSIGAAILAKGI